MSEKHGDYNNVLSTSLSRRSVLKSGILGIGGVPYVAAPIMMPSAASAAEEPRYGGTMVAVMPTDPANLNAGRQNFWADTVKGQVFDSLVRHNLEVQPIPGLAESWEISPDGRTYTFQLAQDVTWHDGTPFTSADVKFSLEEITGKLHPLGQEVFQKVDAVEAPDDHTVIFRLIEPYQPLLDFLGIYVAPIMPMHLYQGTDILENPHNFQDVVGTGPFKLVEWVQGSHLTLERNPDYFQEGLPYLDRVVFQVLPDESTAIIALEQGEVDLVRLSTYEQVSSLENNPELRVTFEGQEAFASLIYLLFNTRNEPLNNPQVRQAIAHAIDVDFIIQSVYFGSAEPGTSPVGSELGQWHNSNLTHPEYDVDLANNLLDEAGLVRQSDNTRFTLRLVNDATRWRRIGDIIVDQLGQIGIQVEHQPVDQALWQEQMWVEWEYDVGIGVVSSGPAPVTRAITLFHSSNIQPGPLLNAMGFDNPEADSLLERAEQAPEAEAVELLHEFQRLIMSELPALPLVERAFPNALSAQLNGFPSGPFTGWRDGFHTIWRVDAPRTEP